MEFVLYLRVFALAIDQLFGQPINQQNWHFEIIGIGRYLHS